MATISKPGRFVFEDYSRWLKNALIFAGPLILMLLAETQHYITPEMRYGAAALYSLNLITDLFRKFINENKYPS